MKNIFKKIKSLFLQKIINKITNKIYDKFYKFIDAYFDNKLDKENIKNFIKKIIIYAFLFFLVTLIFLMIIIFNNKEKKDEIITEVDVNSFISDDEFINLNANIKDVNTSVNLKYPKEKPSDEEVVDRLLLLINENLIKGTNISLNNITEDLNLVTKNNYGAKINYESDKGYVDISNGKIIRPYKNDGDYKDTLKVIVSYNEIKKVKEFYITIKEKDITKEDENVSDAILKIKNMDGTSDAFLDDGKLICEINGEKIIWTKYKKENEKISYIYIFLIVIIFLLLSYNEFSKKKNEINTNIIKLENEFTVFIEDCYLLFNCGMNITNSIIYINNKTSDDKTLKEYLNLLSNQIKLGFNQYKILEEFAFKTQSEKIKKFIRELIVNLKRGNPNMDNFFKNELKEFNNNKKDNYIKIAEENNIKALLPLMIILIATMILVVYPAISNINF